jgi:hypothetical protein
VPKERRRALEAHKNLEHWFKAERRHNRYHRSELPVSPVLAPRPGKISPTGRGAKIYQRFATTILTPFLQYSATPSLRAARLEDEDEYEGGKPLPPTPNYHPSPIRNHRIPQNRRSD